MRHCLRRILQIANFMTGYHFLRRHLGLQLSFGVAALLGGAWAFGGLAEDVVTGDPITQLDVRFATWLHTHATASVTDVMTQVSAIHGTVPMSLVAIFLAVIWLVQRRWYWLGNLILVVPGGMLLNVATKYAFQRARPSFDGILSSLSDYSFPSGHTAGSTLMYGLLTAFIVANTTRKAVHACAISLAVAVVALVAFSRLYLGAHYLTDVLAAIAEAVTWLAVCLTATKFYFLRKEAILPATSHHKPK